MTVFRISEYDGYHLQEIEKLKNYKYVYCFCTPYTTQYKGYGQCDLYTNHLITFTNNKPNL